MRMCRHSLAVASPIARDSCPIRRFLCISALLIASLLGIVFLTSCGGDDKTESPSDTPLPAEVTQALQPAIQPTLTCHVELTPVQDTALAASPIPQTIEIQLLEHPYRVVPNDIVINQHIEYRFIIRGGNEWHTFNVPAIGLSFDIPPGGKAEQVVRPQSVGIFPIVNLRRMPESELISTITVLPEGALAATWHPLCGHLEVTSPPIGSDLSSPFVVQGLVMRASGTELHISHVEARINGELVGVAKGDQLNARYIPHSDFRARISRNEFFITVPDLSPGTHTLILQAFLQNGMVSSSVSMPFTVQPGMPDSSPHRGYRGNIDLPAADDLLTLPFTIQGWVVIHGSNEGTGVGSVEIWNGPRETSTLLTEAVYGLYRSDVAQVLGHPPFANSGFYAQLTDLPAGQVDLHVYVRDREKGEYVSPPLQEPQLIRRVSLAEGKVADAAWPVALAAAPDGRLFFGELLSGKIRILQEGRVLTEPFATLDDVVYHREAGLLGLALHPEFPHEPYIYAMYVVRDIETGLPKMQRVVRFRDVNNVGQDYTVVLDELPFTTEGFHNGGRIAFGPDGKLYLSIGDIWMRDLSQDAAKLPGSILRFNADGSIPEDNPIPGSPVYAIGFRNVFGLAFQPKTGFLFATENGPGGFDEINRVEAGKNYGWPLHMGDSNAEGFADPVSVFGQWPEKTVAPTGATFTTEHPDLLLFCGFTDFYLRGVRLKAPDYDSVDSKMVLSTNCALDVTYGSDGWLYYSTPSAIYRARLDDLLQLHER